MEGLLRLSLALLIWMFEYIANHWQELLIAAVAFLTYKQIMAELEKRRQGEERLRKRIDELERKTDSLQDQVNRTKQEGLEQTSTRPSPYRSR
jgi:hypothetical protein